jgi:hypothetical protein
MNATNDAICDAIKLDGDLVFRLGQRGGADEVAAMIAAGRGAALIRAAALEEAEKAVLATGIAGVSPSEAQGKIKARRSAAAAIRALAAAGATDHG